MTYCSKCKTEERYMPTEQFTRITRVGEETEGERYDFCGSCFNGYRTLRNRLMSAQRTDNDGHSLERKELSPLLIDVDGEHLMTEDNYYFVREWILIKKGSPNESF